jgi:hypothetical protein
VIKPILDSRYEQVQALRDDCLKGGHTFRVYSQVQAAQISQRLKCMGVMLYLLGLSYEAVAITIAEISNGFSRQVKIINLQMPIAG